jgi:uncharacterized protein YndB with AHSA1/START domain
MADFISRTSIDIAAPRQSVWDVLTDLETLRAVMFGSTVETTWEVGTPILYRGEWNGKSFEDKGVIVEFDPPRLLRTTHYSPMSGEPDAPENYHPLDFRLDDVEGKTSVTLVQANNPTQEAADHSSENWKTALATLKKIAEAD